MHAIPATASVSTYILDLVFLSGMLQGTDQNDLVPAVQSALSDLKHQRAEYERAEELEVVATASIIAKDIKLDGTVLATGALLRARHPEMIAAAFATAPNKVAHLGYREEIRAVRTVISHLETLPAGDDVRREFVPLLRAHADAEEAALAQKDQVLTEFALVRAKLARVKASINTLRLEIHGKLEARLKDKSAVERFFRKDPSRAKSDSGDESAASTPSP